jgi:hypothetical protein
MKVFVWKHSSVGVVGVVKCSNVWLWLTEGVVLLPLLFFSLFFFLCETVVPFCFPSLLFSVDEPLVHEIIRGVCDDWCLFKKINFFFIKIYEDNF